MSAVWEHVEDLDPCSECGGPRSRVRLATVGVERVQQCECHENAIAETEARIEERHRTMQQSIAIDRARALSSIGAKFAERTFETFRPDLLSQEAFEVALKCAERLVAAAERENFRGERGVGFCGDYGLGKTHLAAAIANAVIAAGVPVIFGTSSDLLAKLRSTYGKGAGATAESDMRRWFSTTSLLVLDDLGREPATPASTRALLDVVNMRYENDLPIVVTSNRDPIELIQRYAEFGDDGAAMIDRLRELTSWPWTSLRGNSRRGAA